MRIILPIIAFFVLARPAFAQVDPPAEVPPFVFRSLDDSSTVISSEALKGTVYIVDFWATWCPPCVEELPVLTKAYEDFRDMGFDIVSLTFDEDMDRVRRFRSSRFAMPWKNGRVAGGFGDVISMLFNVQNIPYIVLVDREGRIVASGDQLRGEELRHTLRKYLN